MDPRPVELLVDPEATLEGAGVRLKRCIGGRMLDHLDPFLLLDHFGSDAPADYVKGFPLHPHRGIETVTYLLAGSVHHRDTMGNAGRIGSGEVQWMTAGGGIMHEEMPDPAPAGERMEGFQLWVNMPASLKMSDPRYQSVQAGSIPILTRPDGASVKVIAGTVDGVAGPVEDLYVDPLYADVELPPGASSTFEVPEDHNVFAYVFAGAGAFGAGEAVVAPQLAVFGSGHAVAATAGPEGMRFLLVAGRPLGEPIARYGPFVMNTREEIEQALLDLRAGTFVRQAG